MHSSISEGSERFTLIVASPWLLLLIVSAFGDARYPHLDWFFSGKPATHFSRVMETPGIHTLTGFFR